MTYNCKVIQSNGKILETPIEADNIDDLEFISKKRKLTLLSYKKVGSLKANLLSKNLILQFTQTIELLINSNLSIINTLEIAQKSFKDSTLKLFTKSVIDRLKKGDSFSKILKENNPGFTPLYLGLIQVGEKTGTLNIVLNQLYNYLDRGKKFRDKLIGALIYPIFIMFMTMTFSILFILVILPKFNEMFATLGGGLGSTLDKRGSIFTLIIILVISLLLIILSITLYTKKLKKKDFTKTVTIEKFYLKLPIFGKIIIDNETFNLVFALSVLTKSSLNIEQSLDYSKDVITNSFLKQEVEKILTRVISGKKLSVSFSETQFPSKIASFIQVGEKTGNITEIFENLSNFYLKESEKKVERFMTIIDPLFTLILGGILFTLILLFILPVLTQMGDLL